MAAGHALSRIFLSYAHAQEREVADIAAKLVAAGYHVFFDKKSLKGENFDIKIRDEVSNCDLFIVFVSESSLRNGSYVLTELGYAETRWPNPSGHVLAIRIDSATIDLVPAYLRANVILQVIEGNFATGVVNLITECLGNAVTNDTGGDVTPEALQVTECAERLTAALSRRRKLPPTGTATVEVGVAIDALVASIRKRFKPEEGEIVAGARLIKVIGTGNFGTVWEAIDLESQRSVAVKIFRFERLTEGMMLLRFRRSIRAMRLLSEQKRLQRNKEATGTVVAFIKSDPTDLAFSMELLTGGNLDGVDRHGWSLARKLEVVSRVCSAVAYSHSNNIIHRDIKPSNIVLNDLGQAVLTDFDIADMRSATSVSANSEGIGTPVFAAPEQLEDAELANEQSDIYSIGRLLYYLLIERSPGYQVERDPTLSNLDRFPPALVEVVRRATQYDLRRRFASVEALQDALSQCMSGAAALRARVARLRRWTRHNWAVLIFMILVIGAAAYQSKVAQREATYRAKFEDLSTQQAALRVALKKAREEFLLADREVMELLAERLQKGYSPELQERLQQAEKRRNQAHTELDGKDLEGENIDGQLETAKKMFVHGRVPFTLTAAAAQPLARGNASSQGKDEGESARPDDGKAKRKEVASARPDNGKAQREGGGSSARQQTVGNDECQKSPDCEYKGLCSNQNGKCVAAGEDCKLSRGCQTYGECTVRDGKCAITGDEDCRQTINCNRLGYCIFHDGKCILDRDEDCRRKPGCSLGGECSFRNGKCVATGDKDCKRTRNCDSLGYCTFRDGECILGTDADCKRNPECGALSKCSFRDGNCIIGSDADCRNSDHCTSDGRCSFRDGNCIIGSDADCRNSDRCKSDGKCSYRGGQCVVATDADCRMASWCSASDRCSFHDGRCISVTER